MRHHSITKLFLSIFSFGLSTVNICLSQDNLRFEHFTSENGLSENFVYTVYQDKKDCLWIGTHDGHKRHDGYGFRPYLFIIPNSWDKKQNNYQLLLEQMINQHRYNRR